MRRPIRAAACAASIPAWPPPTTRTRRHVRRLSREEENGKGPAAPCERRPRALLADAECREDPAQNVLRGRLSEKIRECGERLIEAGGRILRGLGPFEAVRGVTRGGGRPRARIPLTERIPRTSERVSPGGPAPSERRVAPPESAPRPGRYRKCGTVPREDSRERIRRPDRSCSPREEAARREAGSETSDPPESARRKRRRHRGWRRTPPPPRGPDRPRGARPDRRSRAGRRYWPTMPTGMPSTSIAASRVSRVVPGTSVTIALADPTSALEFDLPAFGRPEKHDARPLAQQAAALRRRRETGELVGRRANRRDRRRRDRSSPRPPRNRSRRRAPAAARARLSRAGESRRDRPPSRRRIDAFAASSVRAATRSRTASASTRSSLPSRNARSVNSPGRAGRAPEPRSRSSTASTIAGLPCTEISARSSPVAESGPAKKVTSARSMGAPDSSRRTASRGCRTGRTAGSPDAIDRSMSADRGPETRTRARADRPGGVASATIVSSRAANAGRNEVKEQNLVIRSQSKSKRTTTKAISKSGKSLLLLNTRQSNLLASRAKLTSYLRRERWKLCPSFG